MLSKLLAHSVNLAHSNIKIYHQRVNTTKYITNTFVSHIFYFSFPLIRTQDMTFVHNILISTHSLKYCALLSYSKKKKSNEKKPGKALFCGLCLSRKALTFDFVCLLI